MKQSIVKYGNPVLRVKSRPVLRVDTAIRSLVKDLLATMYAYEGIGLAAEQIGRTESICVIDVLAAKAKSRREPEPEPPMPMPLVLINPTITKAEGEQVGPEGCLSFPDIYIDIRRAEQVQVAYMDLEGDMQTAEATGLLARAMQHEIDHLNGILFIDRMSPVQKIAIAGKLKRLKQETEAE